MRIAFFYPSLIEDSDCGVIHFIQNIATQLAEDGDKVEIFDPNTGLKPPQQDTSTFSILFSHPKIKIHLALPEAQEWSQAFQNDLNDIELIIIHEQCPPPLIQALGKLRSEKPHFKLLLHDYAHRILSDPSWILNLDLKYYDGVLTSRRETQRMYLSIGLTDQAWIWPEAIRTDLFKAQSDRKKTIETLHTGINTQKDYLNQDFQEYILSTVKEMNLGIKLYGSYTPKSFSIQECKAHIYFRGKAPYTRMPEIYAQSKITFHTPRQELTHAMPRTPSMRLLEALSCEIPVISTGCDDAETLLTPGRDYLLTHNKNETQELIKLLFADPDFRTDLTQHARQIILSHYSALRRAQELKEIYQTLLSLSETPWERDLCSFSVQLPDIFCHNKSNET